MIKVMHLLDDTGLGGVTRGLPDHLRALSDGFVHQVEKVGTQGRLAGPIDADLAIVHFTVNWAKLPYLLTLRARLGRRPLVIVEHSYTEAYEQRRVPSRRRFRAMLRLAFGVADQVVAVSAGQADWLRRANLVPADKLVAIPQGRDVLALTVLPPPGPHAGPLRLGAYGRYADQKGFDVLIEAMRAVSPSVATLDLAGYGPDEEALRRAAADLPHVRIGGQIDGPLAFLAGVDAVVIPSRWEAFGLVGAEARAAARPVIATSVDGLVEQIGPGHGLLCREEDPAALAAAIHDLAGRDMTLMGEAARRSVAPEFARTMSRWSALLRTLAPAPRSAPARDAQATGAA